MSIQTTMLKCYIKGRHLRFSASYFTVAIKINCTFKIEKYVHHKNAVIFSFL